MDLTWTIRYSDDRLSEMIASRPDTAAPLYRIVSRRADLDTSRAEAMLETRRLHEIISWPDRVRH